MVIAPAFREAYMKDITGAMGKSTPPDFKLTHYLILTKLAFVSVAYGNFPVVETAGMW
ncbi:MAG: hypothetical protein IID38_02200 [Planctomycetes bacterium]|nr:hypothetical protein [Planctomycetota bacterium]